jgi:hypothetical protein
VLVEDAAVGIVVDVVDDEVASVVAPLASTFG